MSDREEGGSVDMVGVSLWVCLYWCMWVYMVSIVRNPAARSHMLVQTGHDGCGSCWIWYRLIRFGWPNSGECGVIGNCVPILMYSCCD